MSQAARMRETVKPSAYIARALDLLAAGRTVGGGFDGGWVWHGFMSRINPPGHSGTARRSARARRRTDPESRATCQKELWELAGNLKKQRHAVKDYVPSSSRAIIPMLTGIIILVFIVILSQNRYGQISFQCLGEIGIQYQPLLGCRLQ